MIKAAVPNRTVCPVTLGPRCLGAEADATRQLSGAWLLLPSARMWLLFFLLRQAPDGNIPSLSLLYAYMMHVRECAGVPRLALTMHKCAGGLTYACLCGGQGST